MASILALAEDEKTLEVVPSIDLASYAGKWYELARLPNRFEQKCDGDVTAVYTVLKGNELKVVNQCRKRDGRISRAEGKARLADKRGPNTKLEVRFAPSFLSFLPFVWGDYWILEVATDYSYAMVGEPGRKYLWILARSPQMDEATFQQLVERAAAQGFDTSKLIRTKHSGGE